MVLKIILILIAVSACRTFKPEVNTIKKVSENEPKPHTQPKPDVTQKPDIEHVETLKVLYIKINEVDVPTLSFKKNAPNTYVKFKACNTQNICIRGEAYKDLHAIRNFPIGTVTISYMTCKIKSDLSEEENCSPTKSFVTTYKPETPQESPLSQLLGEQAILEEQMGEQARKIKRITSHLNATLSQCKDPKFVKTVGDKERELVAKIAEMDVEEIIDALSIAGNVGELWELSKLEDQRKENEDRAKEEETAKKQANKNATMNFLNGVLLAGAAIGTFNAIESVAHWQYFWRQQRNLFNSKNEKFTLERVKNSPFLQIREFPGQNFIEDPYTLEIYMVEPKIINIKLHTGNDKLVKRIEIPDNLTYTAAGLIKKTDDPNLYLPVRSNINGSFSFGRKLKIKKDPRNRDMRLNPSEADKNDFKYRKARKDYFTKLGEFRHPNDPLKAWGKTGSLFSGSIQAITIIGAVSTLYISWIFFDEGFHLKPKEHTKPCEEIVANFHTYNEEFKKAYTIYTRLLQIKIEIYMII